MTDRKRFAIWMTGLSETFRVVVGDFATQAYWQSLADLDDDTAERAAMRAFRECKFMPSPAELRELAGASKAVDAALAWEVSRDAVKKHGYTHSLDFGPVVNVVIRNLGGWSKFCDLTNEALPFERKRFEELFTMFTPRAQFLEQRPLAAGLDEAKVVRIEIGAINRKLLA